MVNQGRRCHNELFNYLFVSLIFQQKAQKDDHIFAFTLLSFESQPDPDTFSKNNFRHINLTVKVKICTRCQQNDMYFPWHMMKSCVLEFGSTKSEFL